MGVSGGWKSPEGLWGCPGPSWQEQNESELSQGWLIWCCCPPCRRNQNYSDILHSLSLGDKRLAGFDLTLRFTHLFWFGDLNYRLDMDVQVGPCRCQAGDSRGRRARGVTVPSPAQDILTHIVKKEFRALLAVDQLNLEREKSKVFLRFSECGDKGAAPPAETVAPGSPQPSPCHPQLLGVPPPGTALHGAWGTLVCPEPGVPAISVSLPWGHARSMAPVPPVCPDSR